MKAMFINKSVELGLSLINTHSSAKLKNSEVVLGFWEYDGKVYLKLGRLHTILLTYDEFINLDRNDVIKMEQSFYRMIENIKKGNQ